MRTRFSELVCFLCVACLAVFGVVPGARAQSRPSLGLNFSAGKPVLTITGKVGTVYSVQYAAGLSPTNHWTDRALVQVRGTNDVWSDPDVPTPSQRFYRAVSVPTPTDTNLVLIQPGTFTMGSPTNEADRGSDETQHIVTISRGFWIEKYLVTQGDYMSVVHTNPSYFTSTNGYSDDPTRPVEQVSWFDASNYCALRTQQERAAGLIPTNYAYRLPTESEWEYAARAGTTNALYQGCNLHSGQANFYGLYEYDCSVGTTYNPTGIYLQMTTPVGSYAASPSGLYDMIGNVGEWCEDGYGPYPSGPVTDPQGGVPGSDRAIRGGGWDKAGVGCRSAQRNAGGPVLSYSNVGFRTVLASGQP